MTARQRVVRFFLRQVAVRTGWPVGTGEAGTTLGDIIVGQQPLSETTEPSVTFPLQPDITTQALRSVDTDAEDASSWLHTAGTGRLAADIDLPSLTSRLLKREDESGKRHFDKLGRFDQNATDMAVTALDHAPVLDIAIEQFIRTIAGWSETAGRPMPPRRGLWPDNKKAAVCLSHDADRLTGRDHLWQGHLYWWAKALQCALRARWTDAGRWLKLSTFWLTRNDDPVFCFDDWMKVEEEAGARSTFFFFGLVRALSKDGRRYAAEDPRLKELIARMTAGGWEAGVHFTPRGHLDPQSLSAQRNRLSAAAGSPIRSARHHFLTTSYPASWQAYGEAGIDVASNVGYRSGRNGFRAGTCWPYAPEASGPSDPLIEIPFHIIDAKTIPDPPAQAAVFADFVAHAKRVGGVIVVNYHTDLFSEELAPGVAESYRQILQQIAGDEELLCTTLSQVAALFRRALPEEPDEHGDGPEHTNPRTTP